MQVSSERGKRHLKPGWRVSAACLVAASMCATVVPATAQQNTASGKGSASKAAADDRTVVARLNGKPIYKGEVDQIVAGLSRGQAVDPANLAILQASAVERLIGQQLVRDFLQEKKLVPTDDELRTNIAKMRNELKLQDTTLEKRLQELGSNMTALRGQLANQLSIQKLVAEYGKPELLESYFERHKRHFDGTELRVSHVLLRPTRTGDAAESASMLKQAQQIKSQIEAGQITFADAAKQHSAGPSKSEGGDLGFISRTSPMVEAFSRAAFDLADGKVSDPIATDYGIHLITVTEVKPGDKTLEEVRDDLMPAFTQWLIGKLIERERQNAQLEFVGDFPHFKPGTRQLATEK